MVRFVYQHYVGIAQRQFHIARPVAFALQVSVVIEDKIYKAAVQVWQILTNGMPPYILARGLGSEQNDTLAISYHAFK